jgi:hypothetical protein
MSLADAFAPAEAQHRSRVMVSTWGHLAPTPRKRYRLMFRFSQAGYGGSITVISARLPRTLKDSPWLFEDMLDYAGRKSRRGRVSQFEGSYYRTKTGRGRFIGTTRVIL